MDKAKPVSEEVVEVAARALFETEWKPSPGEPRWDAIDPEERAYWHDSARAALEAAAGMIVAAERERCAGIAEKWKLSINDSDPIPAHVAEMIAESSFYNIATAIRASTEEG